MSIDAVIEVAKSLVTRHAGDASGGEAGGDGVAPADASPAVRCRPVRSPAALL